jgi:hypothetical protein
MREVVNHTFVDLFSRAVIAGNVMISENCPHTLRFAIPWVRCKVNGWLHGIVRPELFNGTNS